MSFDILYNNANGGVFPGGLRQREHIKIMICYLINETKTAVTLDFLCGVLQKCGTANYFEASIGFSELIKNGQLKKSDNNKNAYTISESGGFIADNLSDELPITVREETLKVYKEQLYQFYEKQERTVKIREKENGIYVECAVNDGDDMLMKVNMCMPNNEQAELVKDTFCNNTDIVYQTIVAIMTGDKKTALDILNSSDFYINTDDDIT